MLLPVTQESAYPCPVCHTLTTLEHPCPGCGRAPDPNAAAVITLDKELMRLQTQVDEARRRHDELNAQLAETRRRREAYATAVRMAVAAERSSGTVPTVPLEHQTAPVTQPAAVRAEASRGTFQILLFALGGLVLGIAAIIFTAWAWRVYGVVGRALILSGVTLVMLSLPPLADLRRLRGTAETFAVLGLSLLLLDGYAAWFVDFGGIRGTWDGYAYAGTVCAVTALAAYGYARLFRLTGPQFVALAVAQPVLPLYFAASSDIPEGWGLTFAAVALLNVGIVVIRPQRALSVAAWVFHAVAVAIAFLMTFFVWAFDGTVLSSVALMATALVFAAGALASGQRAHRIAGGMALALGLALALARPMPDDLSPERQLVAVAGAAALVALLAWAVSLYRPPPPPQVQVATEAMEERLPALWTTFDPAPPPPPPPPAPLPNPWIVGAHIGAGIALVAPAMVTLFWVLARGFTSVVDALPWWHADPGTPFGFELQFAVALLAGGAALLTRGVGRELVVVAGLVALALVIPANQPSLVDVVMAAVLLTWALRAPRMSSIKAIAALLLSGHALLAGQGTPASAALVMTGVVALGLAVATVSPKRGDRTIGGAAVGVVDLLLPWLGFTAVAAYGGDLVMSWRVLLLLVLLVPFMGSIRAYRGYHVVAGLVVILYPLWPDLPGTESQAIYAAVAAIAGAIVVFGCVWRWVPWVAAIPILVSLLWTGEDLGRVLWSSATPEVERANAIALTLVLVPIVGLTWRLGRKTALTIGGFALVLPVLMWLAIAGAEWPTLPAVTLLFGLSTIVTAVLRRMNPVFIVVGALLAVSGLYGAWSQDWTRISALGLVVVAMAVVAVAGPSLGARASGWGVGAAAAVELAHVAGDAAGLRPELTAYPVLLVAAILLALAFTPIVRGARPTVEAVAHAAALVAFVLCDGYLPALAGVFALWGVAIGLTALRSQPVLRASLAGAAEAIAWYLVLRSYDVGTLEAYTLPIALVALAVGVFFARDRMSWIAYGPALAAALLPSLGAVLLTTGGEERRLLLGIGALVAIVAGAVWRKQAPFVLGAGTLLVLAIHEIALAWKQLPTWIPLAIAGLLLVGLAVTYEARLRDLRRLRDAVGKMQ